MKPIFCHREPTRLSPLCHREPTCLSPLCYRERVKRARRSISKKWILVMKPKFRHREPTLLSLICHRERVQRAWRSTKSTQVDSSNAAFSTAAKLWIATPLSRLAMTGDISPAAQYDNVKKWILAIMPPPLSSRASETSAAIHKQKVDSRGKAQIPSLRAVLAPRGNP